MPENYGPPFRPGQSGGPATERSELWVRPNRNLDRAGVESYALTFDAYHFAESSGFDLRQFANLRRDDFNQSGDWNGSFQDLRCCLFYEQRAARQGSDGSLPGAAEHLIFFTLNLAICDAWDRERGQDDYTGRYQKELRHAVAAAQSAGEIVRDCFHRGKAGAADHPADERIHETLSIHFRSYGYRGEEIGLVARPRDGERHLWLVDPQDGTVAAGKGFRGAAISIALLREGTPVVGVVYACTAPDSAGDLFYWAEGMRGIRRNHQRIAREWTDQPAATGTALISQEADWAAEANALLLSPMRFRPVTGIAYRLAQVAAGDGELAVSSNGPTGWDVAGGHALLLAAGGDLFNQEGEGVRYDSTGTPLAGMWTCYGGSAKLAGHYFGKSWHGVRRTRSHPERLSFLKPGKVIADPGLLDRAQGCLLGQLAGDALGSLVEFERSDQIARRYPTGPSLLNDGGTWNTIAGQPTDDSELALALARSIVTVGSYDPEHAAAAYANWRISGPFDCGNTTALALSPAAAALKAGHSVAEAAMKAANPASQANGALMRISPLGVFAHALDPAVAMDLARRDARLTHPNPVCQDANAVFVAALAFAIRTGASARAVYDYALGLVRSDGSWNPFVVERLEAAEDGPPPEFSSKMGWVLIALRNAFYRLLYAKSLEEGVVETVRAGGDTDTNAAIAGALLGAVHGRDGVPRQWADRLSSCRPIRGLEDVRHPRPAEYWPVDALALAENLLVAGAGR